MSTHQLMPREELVIILELDPVSLRSSMEQANPHPAVCRICEVNLYLQNHRQNRIGLVVPWKWCNPVSKHFRLLMDRLGE